MNKQDFATWLTNEIAGLTAPADPADTADYQDSAEAAGTIRKARHFAQALGYPDLIPACQTDAQSVPVARDILSRALAVVAPPDSGPLTVKQAAQRLGVSAKTLYRMVEQGKLHCQRTGRSIRFHLTDLQTQETTGYKYLQP
jgi:excisionase family DNA binding protein